MGFINIYERLVSFVSRRTIFYRREEDRDGYRLCNRSQKGCLPKNLTASVQAAILRRCASVRFQLSPISSRDAGAAEDSRIP
jgi:hypothetical protein